MSNPFQPLRDILRVIGSNAEVLPATGQAIVDLVRPDIDETYDQHLSGESKLERVFETLPTSLHRAVRPIPRAETHALRYFIDGSTKTYFIGTVLEVDRSTPVQLSQVGAAMVRRDDDGRVRVAQTERHLLLTLSKLSDRLWSELEATIDGVPGLALRDSQESKDTNPLAGVSEEPRARGAHRANWHMRELEQSMGLSVKRGSDDWLVLDGTLGNEFEVWRGPPVIGIAKTFRRDTHIKLGTGPRAQHVNLYRLLKDLGDDERTAVFSRSDEGKIVFWYVRIRPNRGLDYPLMGVVKVEMPNPSREPVDSDLVDRISGWVIAERTVTPYGRDHRWHAHIYPIYLAEQVVHNLFYSEEVLKSGVRWPFQRSA